MTELRQDPFTRDWVVIAPERAERPNAFPRVSHPSDPGLCPFCPGNEAETPPELWRSPDAGSGWRVRVVPNRFALLSGPYGRAHRHVSPQGFVSMPGVGAHEVVIESPDHSADLARADVAVVRGVLEAYRARYRALRTQGAAAILIFRNHGPAAGTSLTHPHSQIVATPVVPLQIRHRFDVAMQHYDDLGTCLYLDVLARELADGRRVVLDTPHFVAFQPFAAASPFETWLMPRTYQASFGNADDESLDALAPALRSVLAGLDRAFGDPDYNYVLQSAPPSDEGRQCFIWHLRIVPRRALAAGFELGSGMHVNPSRPEDTAAALKQAIRELADPV